jgi:hypothetical protein
MIGNIAGGIQREREGKRGKEGERKEGTCECVQWELPLM